MWGKRLVPAKSCTPALPLFAPEHFTLQSESDNATWWERNQTQMGLQQTV